MQVPVVLAADSNYIMPLMVTVGSVLLSADSQTTYDFRIITDEAFDEVWFCKLKERVHDFMYTIYRINPVQWKQANVKNEGLTVFTFARLLIPSLLTDCSKCIYLDTDLVVMDDLSELFGADITSCYLAGVKDYGVQMAAKSGLGIRDALDIESMDKYVNAGVLLMNLKKIREDHIDTAWIAQISGKWMYEDQDIINKCCYEKIACLPVKYNVLYRYYQRSVFWEKGFYPKEDMQQAQEKPTIIHFTGRDMKPWKFLGSRAAREWWKIAEIVFDEREFQDIFDRAKECWKKMQWDYIKCSCRKKVVIWGYSEKGKQLFQWLKTGGMEVVCFCDSDTQKQGTYLDALSGETIVVKDIGELVKEGTIKQSVFVIASQGYFTAIEKELKEIGATAVLRFFYKTEYYYMALDESEYEREVREIKEKEKAGPDGFTEEIKTRYWMDKWWKTDGTYLQTDDVRTGKTRK